MEICSIDQHALTKQFGVAAEIMIEHAEETINSSVEVSRSIGRVMYGTRLTASAFDDKYANDYYEDLLREADIMSRDAEKSARWHRKRRSNLQFAAAMDYVGAASIAQDGGLGRDKVMGAAFQAYRIFSNMEKEDKKGGGRGYLNDITMLSFALVVARKFLPDKVTLVKEEIDRKVRCAGLLQIARKG